MTASFQMMRYSTINCLQTRSEKTDISWMLKALLYTLLWPLSAIIRREWIEGSCFLMQNDNAPDTKNIPADFSAGILHINGDLFDHCTAMGARPRTSGLSLVTSPHRMSCICSLSPLPRPTLHCPQPIPARTRVPHVS